MLAIDTASRSAAVCFAITGPEPHLWLEEDPSGRALPAAIEALVTEHGRPDAIIVTRGPGSYSGLRVGLAAATGLAYGWGVPAIGAGTLEAVAEAAGPAPVLAIHPMGRGQFAAQPFSAGNPSGDVTIGTLEAVTAGASRVAGEGAAQVGGVEVGPASRCRALVALADARLAAGPAAPLEALYLRDPGITLSKRAQGALNQPPSRVAGEP